jgi:hypothetical protein
MSDSLRDQLLKAGLVTRKQAVQAERQQHQQQHRQTKGHKPSAADEAQRRAAEQARAAKAARDQALNRERQARAEARALEAQVAQILESHRLPRPESDEYFNFVDLGRVRRIPVDASLRERILRESVRIVRCGSRYELVLPEVAERVRERDPSAVITLATASATTAVPAADDDPYKDFPVPDDLMW